MNSTWTNQRQHQRREKLFRFNFVGVCVDSWRNDMLERMRVCHSTMPKIAANEKRAMEFKIICYNLIMAFPFIMQLEWRRQRATQSYQYWTWAWQTDFTALTIRAMQLVIATKPEEENGSHFQCFKSFWLLPLSLSRIVRPLLNSEYSEYNLVSFRIFFSRITFCSRFLSRLLRWSNALHFASGFT